jgi:hypothetical protein
VNAENKTSPMSIVQDFTNKQQGQNNKCEMFLCILNNSTYEIIFDLTFSNGKLILIINQNVNIYIIKNILHILYITNFIILYIMYIINFWIGINFTVIQI